MCDLIAWLVRLAGAAAVGFGLMVAGEAHGQSHVAPDLAQVLPKVTLLVSPPIGLPVFERSPISIPFYLKVSPGVGGARSTHTYVVCLEGTDRCVGFPQVTPLWNSPSGSALTIDAPAAGQKVQVRLVVCIAKTNADGVSTCGHQLGIESVSFDVKMRLEVVLDSFTILHTRAQGNDSTYVALAGIATDLDSPGAAQPLPALPCPDQLTPATRSPFKIYCVGPSYAGDLGDGLHRPSNVRIGDFDMVPGRGQYITFAYGTINYGDPGRVRAMGGRFINLLISKLTLLPAADNDYDISSELNAVDGWTGCDGPTAMGVKRVFNFSGPGRPTTATIDEMTRDTGSYSPPAREFVVESQNGCGNSSKYRVQLTLRRTSWRAN